MIKFLGYVKAERGVLKAGFKDPDKIYSLDGRLFLTKEQCEARLESRKARGEADEELEAIVRDWPTK